MTKRIVNKLVNKVRSHHKKPTVPLQEKVDEQHVADTLPKPLEQEDKENALTRTWKKFWSDLTSTDD